MFALRLLGRRAAAGLLAVGVLTAGGATALWFMDAEGAVILLALLQGLGLLVVGVMVWDQAARTRRDAARHAESTLRTAPAVDPVDLAAARLALEEHEERVFRYLDAMQARIELMQRRSG